MSYERTSSPHPTPAPIRMLNSTRMNSTRMNSTRLNSTLKLNDTLQLNDTVRLVVNESLRTLVNGTARSLLNTTTPRLTYTANQDYPILHMLLFVILIIVFLRSPQIYLFIRGRWLRFYKQKDEKNLPRFVYRHN